MKNKKHSVFHAVLSKKGIKNLMKNTGSKESVLMSYSTSTQKTVQKNSNRKNVLRGRGLNKIKRI